MGYYSDVVLMLSLTARQSLQDMASADESLGEFLDSAYCTEFPSGGVLFRWDCEKWYADDDPEFAAIVRLMEFVRGLSPREYRFVRVGEDYDDIVVEGVLSDPKRIGVSRVITCD